MNFYHDVLLFLHLFGLVMGLGLGLANMFIARWAASSPAPESAMALRTLPPRLAAISTIGLGIMVVTGVLLLFTVSGFASFAFGQFWFWMKLVAVGGMIAVAYLVQRAQSEIKQGKTPAMAEWLPRVGPVMGGLALLATLFAIFVFH